MAIFAFWILHYTDIQMFIKAYPSLQTKVYMMESHFVEQILHICDKCIRNMHYLDKQVTFLK